MKKYIIPKLLGLVLLTMVVLVAISFLEVAIYSYLINPGQDIKVYDAHAELTAPYISGIFGFIVFFMVARFWTKKHYENVSKLVLLFPLVYILFDVLIITLAGVKWSDFFLIFALANSAKALGCYLGYKVNEKQ